MSDYHINIFWSEEDGGYIADIPDLDSCSAFGRSPAAALAAARAEGAVAVLEPHPHLAHRASLPFRERDQ